MDRGMVTCPVAVFCPMLPVQSPTILDRALSRLHGATARFADIRADEMRTLAASFATFFAVLTAYYIVRPMREEMGAMLTREDKDALKFAFVYVFLVMLAAVPVFGWIVSRFPKRQVVPIIYLFFMAHTLVFWLALGGQAPSRTLATMFFVWVSVFNLFVISLFWSVMASSWHGEQAKRLYGVIAAGGTLGALTGPLIAQTFVRLIGPNNLVLFATLFLGLALLVVRTLPALQSETGIERGPDKRVTWDAIFEGARRVWENPYIFRIMLWVLLANIISTYLYHQQSGIVGAAIPDRTARVELYARMDLAVSVLTIAAQLLGTSKVIERFGLGLSAAALPISAMLGFILLWLWPTLVVIGAVIVFERALHFSLSSPSMHIFWTRVDADEKYKSLSFVETVVYRGGDAASGWIFGGLKALGLGAGAITWVTLPFAVIWILLSFDLARRFEQKKPAA